MKKLILLITVFIFSYGVVEAAPTSVTTDSASSITQSSASLYGQIDNTAGTIAYGVEFWYRVSGGSSWTKVPASPSSIASGAGLTAFSASISNLTASITYQYTIVCLDNSGFNPVVVGNGGMQTFTTLAAPSVTTDTATLTTQTTVQLDGSGNANGGGTFHTGLGYKLTSNPTYTFVAGNPFNITGTSSTNFNSGALITGLTAGTTYDYVAALFDGGGVNIVQGSKKQFTTLAASAPTGLVNGTVSNIAATTADINTNKIGSDGASDLTSYGIYIDTNNPPTNKRVEGTQGFGSYPATFNSDLSGGTASTEYHYQAYATNAKGETKAAAVFSFYTEPSTFTIFDSIGGLDHNDRTHLTLYFGGTPGNGSGVIIKAAIQGSASIAPPVDGTVYTGNPAFVGNNQVVYVGSNSGSVTITGLVGTSDYEFEMWEYSGSGTGTISDYGINYQSTSLPKRIKTSESNFPIELLSFTAKNENDNVTINWSTASETDNDYFEIERSTDAENFEAIANIPGAGYSNEVLNYSIQDNAALEGTVYYRLKQTDFNGAFTYSYILPVQIGISNELQISNIINSDNSISFVYNNNEGGTTQIKLLDISGRVVKTQEVSGSGSQLVRIGMGGLSHGVYVLHLTLDNQTIVKKVVF